MKRDMDLVRKILFVIEDSPPKKTLHNLAIEGYDKQIVAAHCEMLYQAGLIKEYYSCECDSFEGVIRFYVIDLTWEGQEFVEMIRQDTVWNKTKEVMKKQGLPFIFDTVKQIAAVVISSMAEGAIRGMKGEGGI